MNNARNLEKKPSYSILIRFVLIRIDPTQSMLIPLNPRESILVVHVGNYYFQSLINSFYTYYSFLLHEWNALVFVKPSLGFSAVRVNTGVIQGHLPIVHVRLSP